MIRKTFTYFLILTALLYAFRCVHYYGLLKQNKGYYAKYKTAFLESNAFDVVFLGSSRVQMHYNTRLFDSITGRNSFNLSLAGATPKIAYAILKIYLAKSKAPEHLFYDIDYHNLSNESKEIKDFNNYFPFLKDETVRSEFSKIDPRMPLFYWLPYYSLPFTGLKNISTGLHGWLNRPNITDPFFYKGYYRESLRLHLDLIHCEPLRIEINTNELNYLDSIIRLCQAKKTVIHLTSSPLFAGGVLDVKNKKELIYELKQFASSKGVDYYDLSSLPFCNQRQLFIDHFHMNAKGSDLFTAKLSLYYRNILQKKTLKE